jgi:hypothetical protein
MHDAFSILGTLAVSCLILYLTMRLVGGNMAERRQQREGMTNAEGVPVVSSIPSNGIAGTAGAYAAAVKARAVQLQDELLVSKYRADYEASILAADDLVGLLLVKQSAMLKLADTSESGTAANMAVFANLATLNSARGALNAAMVALDRVK